MIDRLDVLLTKKDLAARWQVTERTIDQYRENGIIVPIKNLPCIRFNQQYIEKIEGRIPEKITLRERKLERELEDWKRRALKAEGELLKFQGMLNTVVYEMDIRE